MIFKNDLSFTPYKEQSGQLPLANSKQKRHNGGKKMLVEMQRAVDHVFIWFDDEKIFTVEAVTHTRNNKLYARDAEDLPKDSSTHFCRMKPAGVMVWAAVASDGSSSPSVFIDEGVNVNTQSNIKMLTEKELL